MCVCEWSWGLLTVGPGNLKLIGVCVCVCVAGVGGLLTVGPVCMCMGSWELVDCWTRELKADWRLCVCVCVCVVGDLLTVGPGN